MRWSIHELLNLLNYQMIYILPFKYNIPIPSFKKPVCLHSTTISILFLQVSQFLQRNTTGSRDHLIFTKINLHGERLLYYSDISQHSQCLRQTSHARTSRSLLFRRDVAGTSNMSRPVESDSRQYRDRSEHTNCTLSLPV